MSIDSLSFYDREENNSFHYDMKTATIQKKKEEIIDIYSKDEGSKKKQTPKHYNNQKASLLEEKYKK